MSKEVLAKLKQKEQFYKIWKKKDRPLKKNMRMFSECEGMC